MSDDLDLGDDELAEGWWQGEEAWWQQWALHAANRGSRGKTVSDEQKSDNAEKLQAKIEEASRHPPLRLSRAEKAAVLDGLRLVGRDRWDALAYCLRSADCSPDLRRIVADLLAAGGFHGRSGVPEERLHHALYRDTYRQYVDYFKYLFPKKKNVASHKRMAAYALAGVHGVEMSVGELDKEPTKNAARDQPIVNIALRVFLALPPEPPR